MGWRRLTLVLLCEPPAAAADGPEIREGREATAAPDCEVTVSAAERVELRGWLARLTDAGEAPAVGAGAALEDAARPLTAATLACVVEQLERQRCVAFTGGELSRLLVLRARCAPAAR